MNEKSVLEKLKRTGRVSAAQIAQWTNVSELLAALDSIGREGANAVIKIDGGRTDGAVYTVVVSGGHLGEEFFRKDAADLADLLTEAITFYVAHAAPTL